MPFLVTLLMMIYLIIKFVIKTNFNDDHNDSVDVSILPSMTHLRAAATAM
jgi:hypothetical protein